MISYPVFCQIRELHEQKHLTVPQIADALSLDPKTIAKWVERRVYQARKCAQRPSKLDSFKGQIVAQLERHPYTAQQLLQQLKTQGYAGGYSILKSSSGWCAPCASPPFSCWSLLPANAPKSIGAVSALSRWARPAGG
jgi:hypothetical protein